MKKIIIALLIMALAGCTTRTEFGSCVGINETKKPDLEYKVSAWNVFLAVVFVETIVVPIVVTFNSVSCPVGKK